MTVTRKIDFFSDGIRLSGLLHVPDDLREGEKRPAILVCYGRVGVKEWVPARWIPSLLEAGYVCMSFDYRNLGQSDGVLGEIIPQDEVRDVGAATTMLQQQPEVDADNIGVLGWGLGGGVVISAAARDERLKIVICASGVANGYRYGRVGMSDEAWARRQEEIAQDRIDRVLTGHSRRLARTEVFHAHKKDNTSSHQSWHDSLVSIFGEERAKDPAKLGLPSEFTLESLEALYEFIPEDVVHLIAPRPLLVIHSPEDTAFPFNQITSMFGKAGEPKTLIEVVGGGHLDWIDPSHPTQKIYIPAVVSWMIEHLPPREL